MPTSNDAAGLAALSICESLLLAMNDRGLLPENEIVGVLRDAAAIHENTIDTEPDAEIHRAAAALINQIITQGNSVYRPPA
ncbi:MAG: hypothetical protein H5U24_14530 [Thioclava marina]|uniref:Uncharacterized protein n=2 Tax=Celeribacter TaxID=875170 RepID=A0A291G8G4_9RHOB|nr:MULTISPECIES: hypothetical protein [Rhodobacterales]MBK0327259.1 hypothetical protein [Rhodobacteraceae bacterium F11138]AJE47515.1 hypothetical protein P73_2800 [Celeribacter indicus]ATG46428.1 hypothetical protein CEW89_01905 [Celeribacter ethanolicus]MBC7146599.1 hypothetical protein [Thioclava marina]SDW08937.1 hypothetical protein SAMN05443573_101360 [Celeribacter indicus]